MTSVLARWNPGTSLGSPPADPRPYEGPATRNPIIRRTVAHEHRFFRLDVPASSPANLETPRNRPSHSSNRSTITTREKRARP